MEQAAAEIPKQHLATPGGVCLRGSCLIWRGCYGKAVLCQLSADIMLMFSLWEERNCHWHILGIGQPAGKPPFLLFIILQTFCFLVNTSSLFCLLCTDSFPCVCLFLTPSFQLSNHFFVLYHICSAEPHGTDFISEADI